MAALLDPATTDLIWTLAAAMGLMGLSVLTLIALPWSDQEIEKIDAAFRSVGDITTETVPLRSLS